MMKTDDATAESSFGGRPGTTLVAARPEDDHVQEPATHAWMAVLFAVTACLGAALLFVVQPLVAKLLLPSYGGSATVWSTSSLLFQVLLLLAYLYVHWSTKRLGPRRQSLLHLCVLALPLLALPLTVPGDAAPSADASPAVWLLRTLLLLVGVPFAVLATTGPLLQKWFSWTRDRRAQDPYFLFAASNLGSFGGLLAYPLLIEPTMSLQRQRAAWSVGCVVLLVLTAACAAAARRMRSNAIQDVGSTPAHDVGSPSRRRIARWIGLAFLPSSLMLGVTSHLSMDVAAIPLLWVVPLAIYLATFVAAFSVRGRRKPVRATRAAAGLAFSAALLALTPGSPPVVLAIAINLVLLTLVGYAAHAHLAADRPDPQHLTQYYVMISLGGALGGLLNGLLAPLIFDRVLEYPIALMLAPLLVLGVVQSRPVRFVRSFPSALAWPVEVVIAALLALAGLAALMTAGKHSSASMLVILLGASGAGWWLARRAVPVVAALALVFLFVSVADADRTIDQSRSFFGSYTVKTEGGKHVLIHGTTVHGTQWLDASRRDEPTTYYSRTGPLGDVFGLSEGGDRFDRVGIVGLGAGSIAAYGRAGERMTFFEIDPEMVRIARDPHLFTYLRDSAATIATVVGDGRLKVAELPDGSLDLLVLDAFSSDAIPMHLLTSEAMGMYAEKLSADGVLAVHISNRLFDLQPVLAAAAQRLGWTALTGDDPTFADGGVPSRWVVLTGSQATTHRLLDLPHWTRTDEERTTTWTDDYSSLLGVLR